MNFLAHLVLGISDEESLAGAILGDFVRGRLEERFPSKLENAIRLHRRIDDFTDLHPIWKRSRARLSSERRRYAGIIVDVYYDYFLCRHWDRLVETPRMQLVHSAYQGLQRFSTLTDERSQKAVSRMIKDDWFSRYDHLAGLQKTFRGLSQRSARSGPMKGAEEELIAAEEGFEKDFLEFWPLIVAFSEATLSELGQS